MLLFLLLFAIILLLWIVYWYRESVLNRAYTSPLLPFRDNNIYLQANVGETHFKCAVTIGTTVDEFKKEALKSAGMSEDTPATIEVKA